MQNLKLRRGERTGFYLSHTCAQIINHCCYAREKQNLRRCMNAMIFGENSPCEYQEVREARGEKMAITY